MKNAILLNYIIYAFLIQFCLLLLVCFLSGLLLPTSEISMLIQYYGYHLVLWLVPYAVLFTLALTIRGKYSFERNMLIFSITFFVFIACILAQIIIYF
jgi:hypothetical protein